MEAQENKKLNSSEGDGSEILFHRNSEKIQAWLYSSNRQRHDKFLSSCNTDATDTPSTGSVVMGTESKHVSCKYEKLMQASLVTNCYYLFNCMVWLPHAFIFLLGFLRAGWWDMKRIAKRAPLPSEILPKSEGEGGHSCFFHLTPNSTARWNFSSQFFWLFWLSLWQCLSIMNTPRQKSRLEWVSTKSFTFFIISWTSGLVW